MMFEVLKELSEIWGGSVVFSKDKIYYNIMEKFIRIVKLWIFILIIRRVLSVKIFFVLVCSSEVYEFW